MSLDLRCYLVTSGTGRRTVEAAAAAAAGGAGMIQVRAKDASTPELLELACAVADAVHAARPATRVVVDDRVDVAWAARRRGVEVHGVHLGQEDLPVPDARALLGDDAIIGMTTGTLATVRAAERLHDLLDYIGAGPFRPTPTKDSGREPLGLEGSARLVDETRLPVVAIGGLTAADAPALATTGVAGMAVVRAIMDAERPEAVARQIVAAFSDRRAAPGSSPPG
ncbi:thiamine phosphate synthase [Brachybacterium sp. AOP43-C2-M15]|uniref:thiamine phosphate synthase n=1 Tax=Brachybacterium sp. AOP43-C2-M15 TaxID=3457661 RepID=UPI0040331ADF